ncbi:hypothetical protein MUA02_04575 [Enterobacteriaceae bacterium H20N1]|uniref:Uncharacterized protein n=1 Tax=Dryocola boscaweniae TaxID=2925397 RepID=A0A9X2W6N9_9ENTR|nr:hypothetical protein [Dryocola boscaweniae]MCT4701172.1 hypothetical protein [Dryocola boscaweniae]MCT4718323.1 hypothetical protein [Dryocola boscaweniae]
MIQVIPSDGQTLVNTGDWRSCDSDLPYRGKYNVGRYTMGYDFMFQYMHIVHNLPISLDNYRDDTSALSSTENAIAYLEHYGIIDNTVLVNMRNMIKHPKDGFIILQRENVITGIYKDNYHGLQ